MTYAGSMHIIDFTSFPELAGKLRKPFHCDYYAMYSSVYGGIVTDPCLMLVPVDDHLVHRGDGVFDTLKCVDGALYNLDAHLTRLQHSAQTLGLKMPASADEIRDILVKTVRCGGRRDALVRVLISRGPGSFGVNPFDCPEPQLYVVATRLPPPFMETHPQGAKVRSSSVPPKPAFFAAIKSCNYLPNVLMKKEAVELGVDFVVAIDERGCLTEGATENMGIVTRDGRLIFPRLNRILAGTTMLRVAELAQALVARGALKTVAYTDIAREEVFRAAEFLVVGTTPNVTAAVEFDGRPIGDGRPGPISKELNRLLLEDMYGNERLRCPVFPPQTTP